MSRNEIGRRIASSFDSPPLQVYARWKIRIDPAYEAVRQRLQTRAEPIIDVGCGIGLLPMFLRESGIGVPVIGIDSDRTKIDAASAAAKRYRDLHFIVADGGAPLPEEHNIVMIDVLQYIDRDTRKRLLAGAARAVRPGGIVIIRTGLRDGSWRYRFTSAVDRLARVIRWMRVDRIDFPTRDEITAAFGGFVAEVTPLHGRTPFNNYLFVFTRPEAERRQG